MSCQIYLDFFLHWKKNLTFFRKHFQKKYKMVVFKNKKNKSIIEAIDTCRIIVPILVRIPLRRGVLDTTLCDKVFQRLASGFLQVLRFPPPINQPPRYNCNIVQSGVKCHNPNPLDNTRKFYFWISHLYFISIFRI